MSRQITAFVLLAAVLLIAAPAAFAEDKPMDDNNAVAHPKTGLDLSSKTDLLIGEAGAFEFIEFGTDDGAWSTCHIAIDKGGALTTVNTGAIADCPFAAGEWTGQANEEQMRDILLAINQNLSAGSYQDGNDPPTGPIKQAAIGRRVVQTSRGTLTFEGAKAAPRLEAQLLKLYKKLAGAN